MATDTNDRAVLHPLLRRLTEQLGSRLRQRGLAARRLAVAVDYADHAAAAHATSLPESALDLELWSVTRQLLGRALGRRVAVRTVTVTADQFIEANLQLDLWAPPPTRAVVVQRAVDATRSGKGEVRSEKHDQARAAVPHQRSREPADSSFLPSSF